MHLWNMKKVPLRPITKSRKSMMSSRRWGQVQLWDESGQTQVCNQPMRINAISRTFEIHVRIIIIRPMFVDKEGRMVQNLQNFVQKGKFILELIEIELELINANKW